MSSASIRPRVVVIWGLLAALVVTIVVIEQRATRDEESEARARIESRYLVPERIENLGAIEIAHGGAVHRFERDAQGNWFYHAAHTTPDPASGHVAKPDEAARIANALEGFGRTRMERRFELNTQVDQYGVVSPEMFILVYRPREIQPLARYAVGALAPDGVSRYVLISGSPLVVTIANYQIDNLLQLIESFRKSPT